MKKEKFNELVSSTNVVINSMENCAAVLIAYRAKWSSLPDLEANLSPEQRATMEELMRRIHEIGETF